MTPAPDLTTTETRTIDHLHDLIPPQAPVPAAVPPATAGPGAPDRPDVAVAAVDSRRGSGTDDQVPPAGIAPERTEDPNDVEAGPAGGTTSFGTAKFFGQDGCRFASRPDHVCLTSFGMPIKPGQCCFSEARASLAEMTGLYDQVVGG